MKSLKYIAGFAALAMLGACSSDAPEIVGNQNEVVDLDARYISMQIENAATRATGDENDETHVTGTSTENAIFDIQIIIEDNTTKDVIVSAFNTGDITDNIANFKISSFAYNTLTSANTASKILNLYVYVNGKKYGVSDDGLSVTSMNSTFADDTWDLSENNNKGFLMSAAKQFTPNNKGTEDGVGTSTKPWDFTTEVKVDRLAVRFDYEGKNTNDIYTLDSDNTVQLKIVAIAPETRANSTYRVPQYSSTGKPDGMSPFITGLPVTTAISTDANSMGYTIDNKPCLVKSSTMTVYGKPNSLTNEVSSSTSTKDLFKLAPYAIVKAEILTTNTRISDSKTIDNEPVYALNGVLLGGLTYLHNKAKDEHGKVDITNPYESTDPEYNQFNDALLIINGFLDQCRSISDKSAFQKKLEDDLVESYHLVKFTPVKVDDENHYYTYYSSLIVHNNEKSNVYEKYMVLRNHIYNLGVASIKFIGHGYNCAPEHTLPTGEKKDTYIQLTVKPAKWTLNTKNENWAL